MVDSWNSASPNKLSQLINDSCFVTKENVEDIINELTGDILNRVILTSESGKSFILTTDSNNKLIAVATYLENPAKSKIILTSPSGYEFVLKVNNDGSLVTARIP